MVLAGFFSGRWEKINFSKIVQGNWTSNITSFLQVPPPTSSVTNAPFTLLHFQIYPFLKVSSTRLHCFVFVQKRSSVSEPKTLHLFIRMRITLFSLGRYPTPYLLIELERARLAIFLIWQELTHPCHLSWCHRLQVKSQRAFSNYVNLEGWQTAFPFSRIGHSPDLYRLLTLCSSQDIRSSYRY